MLYPKNTEPQLSDELFRDPTSEYRAAPFWAWNCELSREELLWQLEILKKMGMGGAHMHVRTGLTTPYLGKSYLELIKACVEKCRDENMLAWLYDEDRWPSGAAGGIVTKEERFRARHLRLTAEPYSEDGCSAPAVSRTENGHLLACYDVQLDPNGCLDCYAKIHASQTARGTKWYAYLETASPSPLYNGQTYVNTLDKQAIQRFIEVTHQRYFSTVGQAFGQVVPAIFTDEPQFSTKKVLDHATEKKDVILPWTEDLPETFFAEYHEDLLDKLPELIWELPEGQVSVHRYHYHDHTCERFTQAFADQCGQWCHDHGLMLTGHMMDEPTLSSQTHALGEAMRSYRSFQLPGIDMLCNQVELNTVKQAQSAVRQFGREGLLSELYGVTGWDSDFRGYKFQGDWQAALGVTVRVPHLSWVSMKGEAKRDYPASIHYQSPWWQDYAYVENHFARINTAMTRGHAEAHIGVIHPIESFWLHYGPADQTGQIREHLEQRFSDLTEWLLYNYMDFDFISESLLPQLCPRGGAPLKVGRMAYDTILVPGCETLRSSTLERLEAFQAAGGRLIFLGSAPLYENAVPTCRGELLYQRAAHVEFAKEPVLTALECVRVLDIRVPKGHRAVGLLHQLRNDGNDRWLFIAHGAKPYQRDIPKRQFLRISLTGCWSVQKYDTITGEIMPMEAAFIDGKTVIQAVLYDLDSLLLRYSPSSKESTHALPAISTTQQVTKHLSIPPLVEYTLSEPNVYLLDKAEFAFNDAPYHEAMELLRADTLLRQEAGLPSRQQAVAQPWTIACSAPTDTVRLRFRVHCQVDIPNVMLALEDAPLSRIHCNDVPIPPIPNGWFTDKSIETVPIGNLRKGENTISVTIPFGRSTNVEWCYLLGDFGVEVYGEYRILTPRRTVLGFDDVTKQGLAHYGGNITYHIPVKLRGGDIALTVPHFAGTAVKAALAGQSGYIAYPPYRLELKNIPSGSHTLTLTLLGNRHNCFGPVHHADPKEKWIGPNAWRSKGSKWTESYRLKPLGILSAPIIEER